jgi:hypothetical protein
MGVFLFVDESGQDQRDSPYEVLAGVAIHEDQLWNLVTDVKEAEVAHFGMRYSEGQRELKGKKLLKRKTFRHARQYRLIPDRERTQLAKQCLTSPKLATRKALAALGQAKIAFCESVLDLAKQYGAKIFASVVNQKSPRPAPATLRKDYAYLFQRFYYYLQDMSSTDKGIVVFDELEKTRSHVLLAQMNYYFQLTKTGQERAYRIIPEPFFVHSDLTTGVQIADLVAYITSWGIRFDKRMIEPARKELDALGKKVQQSRYLATRPGKLFDFDDPSYENFEIWSFTYIEDLRPKDEREQILYE